VQWFIIVIPATWEQRSKGSQFEDNPNARKTNVREILISRNKLSMVEFTYHLSYSRGLGRRIFFQDQQNKNAKSCLKNKLKKKGLGAWLK
jgi:hypothetical protein